MADQNPPLPQKPFTPPPRPPLPSTPPPPSPAPQRPISPPTGIPVQETDLSHLTPSPAPHLPPQNPPKPTPPPPSTPIIRPAPPTPPKVPTGVPPTTTPRPPASFPSSVRTMAQDMGKSAPQKITIPPPIPTAPSSKPLPPPPKTSAPVNIPPHASGAGKMLWVIIGVLVIAMAVVAFFLFRGGSDEEATPSPVATTTPSPTPTPIGFDQLYQPSGSLSGDLEAAINSQTVGTGSLQTFTAPLPGLSIPQDVSSSLDSQQTYISLFGKPDGSVGRAVIARVTNAAQIQIALSSWETTMARDTRDFFKLNTQRSASAEFLSNTYQNVLIKYRNFPDAYNSLDYALINTPDGNVYLVLTNTRDHMFSIVDRSVGAMVGK